MCRRSLLQCLSWAYPRSGEGLTFLFFAGLMASISLRLLIPFVCSFVSLFGAEPAVGRPPEGETPAAVSSASLAIDPQAQQFRPVITIAELDTLVNPYDAFMLRQTAAALQRALPKYFVRTVTIADAEAKTQIERLRPDFLFAPASFSGMTGVEAARIATRRTNLAQSAERSVGAVFAVRAESRFQSLADLRGRRVFAGLPTAIDGWLAAARELRQQGFEPDHFFGFVGYRNNAYPDVLSALLNGSTDAAILPACLLEAVRMHGLVRAEDIRVINAKTGDLACAHSTALYPDLSLWSLSSAPETAVRDMTVALLGLRDASGYEWLTNVSHADVDGLLKDLEIGPYAYLKDMSPSFTHCRRKNHFCAFGASLFLTESAYRPLNDWHEVTCRQRFVLFFRICAHARDDVGDAVRFIVDAPESLLKSGMRTGFIIAENALRTLHADHGRPGAQSAHGRIDFMSNHARHLLHNRAAFKTGEFEPSG